MGLKRRITSILSAIVVTSMLGTNLNVFAQDDDIGSFHIVNAQSGAEYSIFMDTNGNGLYDETIDTFIGSLYCDENGTGYFNNLEVGDYIVMLNTENGFSESIAFTYDGINCSIKESSQDTTNDNAVTSSIDVTSIKYDVPLFRQNDITSEWANATINGSYDTMSSSGCLICCFSMVRSYETGEYIYPNQMMQPYSNDTGIGVLYSSIGNSSMIIPSSAKNYGWSVYGKNVDYNGNYEIPNNQQNSQELFKLLYTKLQNGPVILGGYKYQDVRSSSNHWIVVTGYVGNTQTFNASDFTINDPGVIKNSTLADYQLAYPYWDRIIYKDNPTVINETLKGDINLDGKVDTYDLLIFRKYVLGICELSKDALDTNDFDGDGIITVNDYLKLKVQLIGK